MRRVQLRFAPWVLVLFAAALLSSACGATENGADATRTEAESEPETSVEAESSEVSAAESDSDSEVTESPDVAESPDDEGGSGESVGSGGEGVGGSATMSDPTGAANPAGTGGQEPSENQGGAANAAGANGVEVGGAGGSGPPAVLSAPGELVIPMQTQTSIELGLLFTEDEAGNLVQAVESSLDLAIGEEYPDVLQVQFNVQDFVTEFEGVRITAMSVDGAGLGVQSINEDTLELTIQEAGEFLLHASGERAATESDLPAIPWSAEVKVTVRNIASVRLAGCVDPSGAVLSGETINLSWPEVVDENGVRFYPANAAVTHPATLTVHATQDTDLSAPDGFRSLIAEGPEQTIRVTSALGDVGSFELITPARVTSLEAWFFMTAPWTRGLSLETGMVQNVLFTEPGSISIQPRLYVNGASLCNAINPDWFEVNSLTPDVCPLAARSDAPIAADSLPMGAQAIAPGVCEIEVTAPTFGDPSLSLTLSVEFREQAVISAGSER